MRVEVLKSSRDDSLYAKLPECLAFFHRKEVDDLIVGNTYDVMITGYSNTRNRHTGMPSAVFVSLVTDEHHLITAPILETSGSMCSTSTWHKAFGPIYPGHRTPVPGVDNVNASFREMPHYPTPEVNMWIRKNKRGSYSAVGVDCYAHIEPVFKHNCAEYQRVNAAYAHMNDLRERYRNVDVIDGLRYFEAFNLAKDQLGLVRHNCRCVFKDTI
jgi:hypothetical protein